MRTLRLALMFAGLLALSACAVGIALAPPPNLYSDGANFPSERVAPILRTTEPALFYMTDRNRQGAGYGTERSASMAFGTATVSFGEGLDWTELVARTHADSGQKIARLQLTGVNELVRFEATPLPYARKGGYLRHLPEARAAYEAQTAGVQAACRTILHRRGTGAFCFMCMGSTMNSTTA